MFSHCDACVHDHFIRVRRITRTPSPAAPAETGEGQRKEAGAELFLGGRTLGMEKGKICLEERILEEDQEEPPLGSGALEGDLERVGLGIRPLEIKPFNSFLLQRD